MSWGKVVINNAFYVFPSTGVKTFPQVELNRQEQGIIKLITSIR